MAPRHSYEITSQAPDQTTIGDAGNVIVGTYVYFITGDGNSGVVFIPNNLFNEDHVKATVRAAVRRIDRIGKLSEQFD